MKNFKLLLGLWLCLIGLVLEFLGFLILKANQKIKTIERNLWRSSL